MTAANTPVPAAPNTVIDTLLGGDLMRGKKTLVGVLGLLFLYLGDTIGFLNVTETWMSSLNAILASYAGLGAAAKVERVVRAAPVAGNAAPPAG